MASVIRMRTTLSGGFPAYTGVAVASPSSTAIYTALAPNRFKDFWRE
jgi:hypothetical protein